MKFSAPPLFSAPPRDPRRTGRNHCIRDSGHETDSTSRPLLAIKTEPVARRKHILTALAAAALALAGCDGSPTLPSVSGEDGAMRFSYSGAHGGTFNAVSNTGPNIWAYAEAGNGYVTLRSQMRKADGSEVTLFVAFADPNGGVFVAPAAPQTITIDVDNCPQDVACAGGTIRFTPPHPIGAIPQMFETFNYRRGTIHITARGNGRIRGTLSGDLVSESSTLSVRDGEFDLALLPPR